MKLTGNIYNKPSSSVELNVKKHHKFLEAPKKCSNCNFPQTYCDSLFLFLVQERKICRFKDVLILRTLHHLTLNSTDGRHTGKRLLKNLQAIFSYQPHTGLKPNTETPFKTILAWTFWFVVTGIRSVHSEAQRLVLHWSLPEQTHTKDGPSSKMYRWLLVYKSHIDGAGRGQRHEAYCC